MQQSIAPCSTNGHVKPAVIPSEPALYEAPISLNCFVEVPGLGRTQITARAHTEREAVQHLLCAAEQLKAQTQPQGPAPAPKVTLGALLACGLERAVQKGDLSLVERLSKAAALVLAGKVEPGNRPDVLAVWSQTNPEAYYEVESGVLCTCPDWKKHHANHEPRYRCKHMLSALFYIKLNA